MITLHFNPQFDSGAWSGEPGKGNCKIGDSYVGPMGLLTFLEVKLGITALEQPQHELLTAYTKAAQDVSKKHPGVFFTKSLQLTPLATASELLKWRDELVLSGWKADTPVPDTLTAGAKAIFAGLAKVESSLPTGFRTTADRWRALLALLGKDKALDGFSVKVHVKSDHLHPVHQALLKKLTECGISVEEALGNQSPAVDGIKHFHDSSDACLWTAAQDGDALIVCADDQTMSSAMSAFARPFGNASASETPRPVNHLFTSAMMLLKDGGDIHAFRDYLSAPSHPLKHFEKDGRSILAALLNSIISQHGFEKVDQILEDFAEGDAARLADIRQWIPEPGQPLTYARIEAMCKRISDWANRAIKGIENKGDDSIYLEQWEELASACEEMKFQCKELDIDNHPEEFFRVLRNVSAPSAAIARRAVVESVPVVSAIEKIAVDVHDVIWVDGSFTETATPLSFLCPKDVLELKMVLPETWLQEDALQLTEDLFQAGLSHIGGKLTILYCDAFAGEKREKHPFILRQVKKVDDLRDLPYASRPQKKSEPCPSIPVVPIPEENLLVIDDLALPDHESPTTLEGMFEQPLDWVLRSILHLNEESDSNDSLIKGLVAHDIIHQIYAEAAGNGTKVDADEFERVFKADFDNFFAKAVLATGAELNLPENKLDREQFKFDLRTVSIPKLIEIIRHSHLTIVGSEVRSEKVDISTKQFQAPEYEPLLITGTIDLLLKNEAGHYVILDFKWAGSKGRDMREAQIKKGEDYQLALYRRMAEIGTNTITKGDVDAQGFFMLRKGELLTAYPTFRDRSDAVKVVPPGKNQKSYEETLEEIHRKYTDTVRAFGSGKVSAGNLKDPYLIYKVLKGKLN